MINFDDYTNENALTLGIIHTEYLLQVVLDQEKQMHYLI